jgi:hypothetical protein
MESILHLCKYAELILERRAGKELTFSSFESQGRFADYFNRYAESIRPAGNPTIIPGVGIAKILKRIHMTFL